MYINGSVYINVYIKEGILQKSQYFSSFYFRFKLLHVMRLEAHQDTDDKDPLGSKNPMADDTRI